MKPIDISAISIGTVTGSALPLTVQDVSSADQIIASAGAALAVYLVNALLTYLGRRFFGK